MKPAPECSALLATGRKCRAAATRGRAFCRHHDPTAKTAPATRPISKRDLFSRLRRWSQLSRDLPWLDPAEIPAEAFSIFLALLEDGEGGISDREAGRLLRGLFRRLGAVPFAPPRPPHCAAPPPPTPRALDPDPAPALLRMLASLGAAPPATQPPPRQPQPPIPHSWPPTGQPRPSLTASRPSAR
jgi:hypothetical protein